MKTHFDQTWKVMYVELYLSSSVLQIVGFCWSMSLTRHGEIISGE